MKKVNDLQKKKLDLKKRTIMKLNDDMMIKLAGGVTITGPASNDFDAETNCTSAPPPPPQSQRPRICQ